MTHDDLRFDADDPRFTAYALGEIDDSAERAAIEAVLERHASAREYVAAIRETGDLLTAELSAAPQPQLSDIQRQSIKQAAARPATPSPRRALWIAGAAAAAVAVIAVIAGGGTEADRKEVASHSAPSGATGESSGESSVANNSEVFVDSGAPIQEEVGDYEALLAAKPASTTTGVETERGATGAGRYDKNKDALRQGGQFAMQAGDDGLFARDNRGNREAYSHTADNPFTEVAKDPRSTFSIDVDTGSYSNVRRMLNARRLPPADAVRIEEMINYFDYEYPQPATEHPFSLSAEVGQAPWSRDHLLVKVGVQGKELSQRVRPRANLVFLVDVSGSMSDASKLPLLKRGIGMLVKSLDPEDRVAVVVYASASGLVLPSTPVSQRRKILGALDRLSAGGSTNGGAGIELAYKIAADNFVQGGINRVLLATDGDFNVGVSHTGGLVRLVEDKAKSGVFLTVLGFGMGNYNDAMLEEISNKGNGHYAYIDTVNEARKVLVHELDSTLMTIAKDVKIQVEFNPKKVASYRLIGYANRILAHRDFDDDAVDAGEIGAGHSVTALYEIVPARGAAATGGGLKYQSGGALTAAADADELMNLKLRYKKPDGDTSRLVEVAIPAAASETPSGDFKLAAGVAAFGMLLRNSEHRGDASYPMVLSLVEGGVGRDLFGYRRELVSLVRKAAALDRNR
jgi:Ca-activated chloride channel family protein